MSPHNSLEEPYRGEGKKIRQSFYSFMKHVIGVIPHKPKKNGLLFKIVCVGLSVLNVSMSDSTIAVAPWTPDLKLVNLTSSD